MPLTVATKITISRILIIPLFIFLLLFYSPDKEYLRYAALVVFIFAIISDIFDGFIARMLNQETRCGAVLDPLADKILILSAFICLCKISVYFEAVRFPRWLIITVIAREAILIMGAVFLYFLNCKLDIRPTVLGKATAFCQVLSILTVLLQIPFSIYLWHVTVIFTVASGIDYIKTGVQLFRTRSFA